MNDEPERTLSSLGPHTLLERIVRFEVGQNCIVTMDIVARLLERLADEKSHGRFVIHHQHERACSFVECFHRR
jgi:hypothetical protein